MNKDEFQAKIGEVARRRGGFLNSYPIDPEIDEMVDGSKVGTLPNPSPTYRYVFGDGTYIDAKDVGQGDESVFVVRGGTALRDQGQGSNAPKTVTGAGTNEPFILTWNEDGSIKQTPNPNYRAPKETASKGEAWKPVYFPNTNVLMGMQDSAGNYRDVTDSERRLLGGTGTGSAGGGGGTGGGTSRVEFESERALREAQQRTEEAQAGYYGARTDYEKAQTDKTRRDMQGKTALAIQNYYDAIEQVAEMLRQDQLKPAEADTYLNLFRQNFESELRGTTPFEETKFRTQEKRQRAEIGKDLLNQRLSSSTSMANTLLSGFFQNLPSIGAGVQPGQNLNFDPFALAGGFAEQQQGGPEVGNLGRSLLMGLQEGPQGAPMQGTAGTPPPQGLQQQPVDIERLWQMAEQGVL